MIFRINTRGQCYYLKRAAVGSSSRFVYCFSCELSAETVESLPPQFAVAETRTGLPIIRRVEQPPDPLCYTNVRRCQHVQEHPSVEIH